MTVASSKFPAGILFPLLMDKLAYPESNRGVGQVFTNFAISTGARVAASLAQEFLLRKLTPKRGHSK
jgi:hypothetical protein